MALKAISQVSLTDITDAYSVTLTSESYTFIGDTTGAPAGLSCDTKAIAYRGTEKCLNVNVTSVICPTGISSTISNNNTESPTITFTTTDVITETCEATIDIVVDEVEFTKKFSFAVAKEGSFPDDWYADADKTYIDGGKIYTGSITAEQLNTNAIKSRNYVEGQAGTFFDLENGNIQSKNFKLDAEQGHVNIGICSIDGTSAVGQVTMKSTYGTSILSSVGLTISSNDGTIQEHYGTMLSSGGLQVEDILCGTINANTIQLNSVDISSLYLSLTGGTINGNLTCYGTVNASTLQQGGQNISNLFATKSHSHSYLPLSGGTLSGTLTMPNNKYIKGKDTAGSTLNLIGINDSNNVHLGSYGLTHNVYIHGNKYQIDFSGAFLRPNVDDQLALGSGSKRWTAVYAKNGAIQTSDRNRKKDIAPITDVYEQLFDSIKPVSYMFNDGDRTHIGAIAQDIEESMTALGLTSLDFGGLCRDQVMEYDYDEEGGEIEGTERPVLDENGQPKYEYSLRYSEFIMLAIDQIQKLKKRVEELEAKLAIS